MKRNDQECLIAFWNKAFAFSEEDRKKEKQELEKESWRQMAPSEKLFRAAAELGKREHVLDFGCGTGWAGIIVAKNGCERVLCADAAENAVRRAQFYASLFDVSERVTAKRVGTEGLFALPEGCFDGLICSNVLDVVPPEVSERLIRRFAELVTEDAEVVIGLNYALPAGRTLRANERMDGNCLYVDGVLRLVSFTDEEWERRFEPYFRTERLERFAWPGEQSETRRLFRLRRRKQELSLGELKTVDRVSLLVLKDGRLLTARSRDKDVFYIPGGKREPGESDRDTLFRETGEELGVSPVPGSERFFGVFRGPAHGKPEGTEVRLSCYTAELDGEPAPSSEVEELRWMGMENLPEVPPADVPVYRALFENGMLR